MKIGIAGKLILTLSLCALLVLGVTGVMEYHAGHLLIEREVETKLAGIGNRLILTLRRSVYEFDRETVRDTILAEFPEEGLEAVAVWTRDRQRLLAGLVRQEDGQVVDSEVLPRGTGRIERVVPLRFAADNTAVGQVVVGEFALVFDQRYMQQRLLNEIASRQIKNALMILLLLLILGEVVRRSLVWPLEKLRESMVQAESAAFTFAPAVAGPEVGANGDRQVFAEMKQMTAAFRRMIEAIAHRQKDLAVSEERYRELVEGTDTLVVKLDANFICTFINNAVERFAGVSPQECIGHDLNKYLHPEDREDSRKAMVAWMASHENHGNYENRVVHVSGQISHVSWTVSIGYDDTGAPAYFRCFGRDITAQKGAEQKLRENEAKFRAAFHQSFELIGLLDPQGRLIEANNMAMELIDAKTEEVRGLPFWETPWWQGLPEEQGKVRDAVTRAASGELVRFETKNHGRDRDPICIDFSLKPVYDDNGRIVYLVPEGRDITERQRLLEESTRASHLAALGSLSAGVAHEINNPTGLILMSVPVVQAVFNDMIVYLDELPDAPSAQMFGGLPYEVIREEVPQNLLDILGGAQRIRTIVEDLKNFARQEEQGFQELVDLGAVVNQARRLLQNLIKNSTQRFTEDVAADLPKVPGSSQRLEQVVVNLLQNACHALSNEEQAIVVRVFADRSRRQVILQVRDEGVGIPLEIREKITDPFFTTRRETGGTGLGLSVSARIINEHGGNLRIESESGQGSTFTVELPAYVEDDDGD